MIKEPILRKVLITGGAGFIGSHVVRHFVNNYPDYQIYNLDALTYAGNLENLSDVESAGNYSFLKADITDKQLIFTLFKKYSFDAVIHLAAESHVDRSIADASDFVNTNVKGTVNLLDACRKYWRRDYSGNRFYHISTDEVYGSIAADKFNEDSPYHPNSPYAASKAASDHFVRAYGTTHGLPVVISNCSNNYGPFQFPEKLVPLFINNIIEEKNLPLYGEGDHVRDWLYVEDHVRAIDLVFHKGGLGETYCIGGGNELTNIDLAKKLCGLMDKKLGRSIGKSEKLITFVSDRPGHDFRYAIDSDKIFRDLGWEPQIPLLEGLKITLQWYLDNPEWLEHVTNGSYERYYEEMYKGRELIKKNVK